MLPAMSIYSIICFIMIQIISSHSECLRDDFSSTSNKIVYPAKTWQSGANRTKRSIYDEMPQILKVAIQLEEGPIINAKLVKQLPHLANKNLPVVGNHMNSLRNVMDDVGEFVVYQDIDNCIAIVYFYNFGSFYGVIGLNHHIADLPYNFDTDGNYQLGLIGKPYIEKNNHQFHHINPNENYPPPSDTEAWEDFLRPFSNPPAGNHQPFTSEQPPSTSRQNSQQYNYRFIRQYYVETLVLVTRDLANFFKENFGEDGYVAAIVRYHIIYFNAVNMLLNRLKTLKLYFFDVTINIAKIVIEDSSTSFDFETQNGLQFRDVTTKLPHLFSDNPHSYVQESFDYVFVHTNYLVMDENTMVNAITKCGLDMVEGRKTGKFYETIPITIAKLKSFYAHYPVAAHEIGRTLGMKITPKESGLLSMGQCYNIMQREGPKCDTCMVWSDKNIHQILTFFSSNRNRCFLLNLPRSLYPPAVIKMLTPHDQCQCLGYKSYMKAKNGRIHTYVGFHHCSIPLRCWNVNEHQISLEDTMLPFDGTLCSKNKVCWNGTCRKIEISPIVVYKNRKFIVT